MRATPRRHNGSRWRRAIAMLWFAGVFLLVSGFTGTLSVDYGQVLMARSEIESATSDAAVAAAREYDMSETLPIGALLLDQSRAERRAREVIEAAIAQGSIRRGTVTAVNVTFENNSNALWFEGATIATVRPPRVTVTVTYTVTNLLLMDLFAAVGSSGSKTVLNGTKTASAVICLPGLNPDTFQGSCVRSQN